MPVCCLNDSVCKFFVLNDSICLFVVSMNQCAIYCFNESFFFSIPKFIGVFSFSLQWVWFKQKGVVKFSEPSFKKFTYALAEYKF